MNNWESITTEKRKAMEACIERLETVAKAAQKVVDYRDEGTPRDLRNLEQSLQKAYEELETLKTENKVMHKALRDIIDYAEEGGTMVVTCKRIAKQELKRIEQLETLKEKDDEN